MFTPKQFAVSGGIEGLSERQMSEHYKLYEGYVKKANEIREKLDSADQKTPNATYSELGELKRQESFALNGIKLHEAFFGVLGGHSDAKGSVADMIVRDFGSIEAWKADMTAAGIAARGWVLLAYDPEEGRLHNFSADAHNLGIVAGAKIILALDVYEHAYFIDYGTNRKDYIETFFKNLDWGKIEERFKI